MRFCLGSTSVFPAIWYGMLTMKCTTNHFGNLAEIRASAASPGEGGCELRYLRCTCDVPWADVSPGQSGGPARLGSHPQGAVSFAMPLAA
jgi:hypothetical protein